MSRKPLRVHLAQSESSQTTWHMILVLVTHICAYLDIYKYDHDTRSVQRCAQSVMDLVLSITLECMLASSCVITCVQD